MAPNLPGGSEPTTVDLENKEPHQNRQNIHERNKPANLRTQRGQGEAPDEGAGEAAAQRVGRERKVEEIRPSVTDPRPSHHKQDANTDKPVEISPQRERCDEQAQRRTWGVLDKLTFWSVVLLLVAALTHQILKWNEVRRSAVPTTLTRAVWHELEVGKTVGLAGVGAILDLPTLGLDPASTIALQGIVTHSSALDDGRNHAASALSKLLQQARAQVRAHAAGNTESTACTVPDVDDDHLYQSPRLFVAALQRAAEAVEGEVEKRERLVRGREAAAIDSAHKRQTVALQRADTDSLREQGELLHEATRNLKDAIENAQAYVDRIRSVQKDVERIRAVSCGTSRAGNAEEDFLATVTRLVGQNTEAQAAALAWAQL